ncbi:MAG TPA: response regulator transcription factor [Gemmatimonadales bacterium]
MRILLVEDDPKAARFVRQGLQEEGYVVDVAGDGADGSRSARTTAYDLFILDVQLPGMTGLELARELRRNGVEAPVLMLTARDSTEDVVHGLDAGADDYLTKPFAFDELLARVRALTRRHVAGPAGALRYGQLEMDRLGRSVRVAGHPVDLSPREFRLLEHFLLHPEEIVTRTRLLERVWDMSFDPGTNVVEAHISNLRRKLEERGAPRLIQTVRGAGYALRPAR